MTRLVTTPEDFLVARIEQHIARRKRRRLLKRVGTVLALVCALGLLAVVGR